MSNVDKIQEVAATLAWLSAQAGELAPDAQGTEMSLWLEGASLYCLEYVANRGRGKSHQEAIVASSLAQGKNSARQEGQN